MKCNLKRLLSGLLVLMILTSLMVTAVSADALNLKRKCSLNMKLEYTNEEGQREPVTGTVGLYQIALTRYDNGDQVYVPTASFVSADIDLDNIADEADLLAKVPVAVLEEHIKTYYLRPKFTAQADDEGIVRFRNLPAGLYLVTGIDPIEGPVVYKMNSFLVTLPRLNQSGDYDYACRTPMQPKVEISKELIDIKVIKVWKGDKPENRPKSITVDLLNEDGFVAETKTLSPENFWSCTFYDKPADVKWDVQEGEVKGYKSEVGKMVKQDDHYEIVITNTLDPDNPLAQTGQLNWPIPFLVVGGLIFCIAGYVVSHQKKRTEE